MEVQGRPAEYGELDPDFGPYPRAVLWHDADGHWFRVSCDLDRAGILRIAEGVHSADNPMRVPFRLASIPAGVSMVQLIEWTRDGEPTTTAGFELPDSGRRLSMEVSNVTDPALNQGKVERREIAGREVEIRAESQSLCILTESQPICVSGPGDEPASDWSPDARAVAVRTAELLSPIDDPDDEASWLDADQAFPR